MSKVTSTITIDNDIKELAKRKGINISSAVEKALKKELKPDKSDLPNKVLIVRCTRCKKEIEEGFLCVKSQRVWCGS